MRPNLPEMKCDGHIYVITLSKEDLKNRGVHGSDIFLGFYSKVGLFFSILYFILHFIYIISDGLILSKIGYCLSIFG